MIPSRITLDIEVTNRCNADCSFCPRDQTPHQGLMSRETFTQTLFRAVELRDLVRDRAQREVDISLSGLGEPLLNPRTVESVQMVTDAGIACAMASNGSLLSEEKARRLLDAGLTQININVGEEGEDYERAYGLPFETTRANVVRFAQMAEGRCRVTIVLVDHRGDEGHRDRMVAYWREQGLEEFFVFPLMNRGGALDVERMRYDDVALAARARGLAGDAIEHLLCVAPFMGLFVGYDGEYYLCGADWRKEASFGNVFDQSFVEVLGPKLTAARTREQVCHTCSIDPTNHLVDALREHEAGTIEPGVLEQRVGIQVAGTQAVEELVEALAPGLLEQPAGPATRRLIPVRPA